MNHEKRFVRVGLGVGVLDYLKVFFSEALLLDHSLVVGLDDRAGGRVWNVEGKEYML